MVLSTAITLTNDQLWVIAVIFAFLVGHISGIAVMVRSSRSREHNVHID
jgi:hypothetical protein